MDGRDVRVVLHQEILLIICPLEFVRNRTLSDARESYSWGGVLVGRGPLLWNFQREVPGGLLAARCCWVLGAMGAEQRESCECRGSLVLENIPMWQKPCAWQELSSRQPANTTGAWCWRSCTHIVGMRWASTPGQESKILSAIPFPFHLLTKLNIMPAINGKIFKGPRFFFTEQEKRCIGAKRQQINIW